MYLGGKCRWVLLSINIHTGRAPRYRECVIAIIQKAM